MPLSHVCVWDSKIGYRRITVEKANELYPYEVSARGSQFVCELCAQNVGFSKARVDTGTRYFFHSSAEQNKECEDRQIQLSQSGTQRLVSLNSHVMPLRLVVTGAMFSLQLGFFCPPDHKAHCDKIKIAGDSHQVYEYSFERIERIGTTYLSVGSIPSRIYELEYVNANTEIERFWPNKITGINTTGAFFDGRTGRIIQPGGKACFGNSYYLLQRRPLCSDNLDIEVTEVARAHASSFTTWHLYKIHIKRFSAYSAKFFLKYAVFLTEKPTKFYPIWPAYIMDPYFIYHNSPEVYFYLCGDDAELKSYPATANVSGIRDGKLYKLCTREREQLISLGKSGALGFSYLIKQPLNKSAPLPTVTISDYAGELLTEEKYSKLPKSKLITVLCRYDGRAIVRRKGKIDRIYKLSAEQNLEIDGLAFGTEIHFYQGCDCVRTLCFEREKNIYEALTSDDELIKKLTACPGPMLPVAHSAGALADKFAGYPKTRRWLYEMIRRGEMSYQAYRMLIAYNPEGAIHRGKT